MNNLRIQAVFLIVVMIGVGALAFFATKTQNWTLLVLTGYSILMLIALTLLAALRYLSRKVRTEGRNSRAKVEVLREVILTLEGSLVKDAAHLEQATERIASMVELNGTAISKQRKELKTASAATTNAVSTLQKALKLELESLSLAVKQLEAYEVQIVALQSTFTGLKDDLSERMRNLEQELVSSTDLKDARDELLAEIRTTERRLSTTTPKTIDIKRFRERLESAESRILGTVESEAFDQGSTLHDQTQALKGLRNEIASLARGLTDATSRKSVDAVPVQESDPSQLKGMVSTLRKHITTTVRDGTRQVESLIQLAPYFSDKKMPMPSTGNFAIDAQALAHLITLVNEQRPKKILELGSGTSTIWLGYLCKSYGGKLITLDHLSEYLEQTKIAIERHELNDEVEARLAPLEELECHGEVYNWYSKSSFKDLIDIDLVVIDGPPAATGRMARYPALPKIIAQLSSHATVVLDDAHRDEEASIIAGWLEHFPEFRIRESGTSRLAVLQRGRH